MAEMTHTKPISTLHLAWAAGFIEGEGWFLKSPNGSAQIGAAQVQREPLERLQALFGGKLVQRNTNGHSKKKIWFWSLTARRSIEVMMTLYVLMSPRRQGQIETALSRWKSQKRILRSHGSDVCGRGHALTADNIYVSKLGHHSCKACKRLAKTAYLERQKAKKGGD